VSQYLRCPRSYRFRYLDGWREKESKAALCFGRCFEKAIAAFFEREDAGAVLFTEWGVYRDVQLEYSHGDDWERLLRQGIALLEQFARDNRIRIRQPKRNMQKKLLRPLPNGNEFLAYVDAIGQMDGTQRLLEWKTTSARYPDQPEGLTSLDLQLVCYSWISGISDVAIVAFVRKRIPEIQYLLASIMVTPIPPPSLPWSTAPKCASPKLAPYSNKIWVNRTLRSWPKSNQLLSSLTAAAYFLASRQATAQFHS
jgi:hypothetical protein